MANEPGWPITRKANYLSPSIITALSTSTRLPWEGSPRPSRLPSVSQSEESTTSGGPGGIESTATPSEGSSLSEGQVGIQSTATPGEGSSLFERPVGIQSTATPSDGVTTIDDNYFHQKFKTRPR